MTHINLTTTPQTSRSLPLLVPGIAQALIALDYAIVYVALPTLAQDLALTAGEMQWVVSLYGLIFAGLLLLGEASAIVWAPGGYLPSGWGCFYSRPSSVGWRRAPRCC
jgi:MFS family permease